MSELFIELLSEEIPYWLQKNVAEQFKNKITDVIIENNLSLSKRESEISEQIVKEIKSRLLFLVNVG